MPRYIEPVPVDPAGIIDADKLPVPLPYGLTPRDFLRTVEDVHDLLHDINSLLHERQYERLEELLDAAGFSGLISRTVANRLARASRGLAVNQYHNGYPDLLVKGQYPGDAVAHGEGGLEIKASRYAKGWQSHGPRSGWFAVVQFRIDDRRDVAIYDLEPTAVQAVLVAPLDDKDWSWQPAREGRIRSGTASVRASATAKLRAGAVWIDPAYRAEHDRLAREAALRVLREELPEAISAELRLRGGAVGIDDLTAAFADRYRGVVETIQTRIQKSLRLMQSQGIVLSTGKGTFKLVE